MSDQERAPEPESAPKAGPKTRRIEADPRTEEFVILFQRYGETVVNHVAKTMGRPVDTTLLDKINSQIEPLLRSRVESLVNDYLRSAYESLTGEEILPGEVGYRVKFPRRHRYHLRFLTLSFADLVAFDETSLIVLPESGKLKKDSTTVFPKALLEGVDMWSRQVLDLRDLEAANMVAFKALDRLDVTADTDLEILERDRDLWRRLFEMDDALDLICPVLVPLLKPFAADFDGARTVMQRLIGNGSDGRVQLNAQMWDLLFSRLFGRLMKLAVTEGPGGADKFDHSTLQLLTVVSTYYRRWRKDNQLK